MSWLLDPPFVLETPLATQLMFAIPFWTVYFAVKGVARWRRKRAERRWLEYLAPMSRRARDEAVVAMTRRMEREYAERNPHLPWLN